MMKGAWSARSKSGVLLCGVVMSACAHAAPKSSPATNGGDRGPCSVAGSCIVRIAIPDGVLARLADQRVSFKVYRGCPSNLGFRSSGTGGVYQRGAPVAVARNSSMRAAASIIHASEMVIALPAMTGDVATVGIFYGPDPGKYAVADFGSGPDQTVTFGYTYVGGALVDDSETERANLNDERRICR